MFDIQFFAEGASGIEPMSPGPSSVQTEPGAEPASGQTELGAEPASGATIPKFDPVKAAEEEPSVPKFDPAKKPEDEAAAEEKPIEYAFKNPEGFEDASVSPETLEAFKGLATKHKMSLEAAQELYELGLNEINKGVFDFVEKSIAAEREKQHKAVNADADCVKDWPIVEKLWSNFIDEDFAKFLHNSGAGDTVEFHKFCARIAKALHYGETLPKQEGKAVSIEDRDAVATKLFPGMG